MKVFVDIDGTVIDIWEKYYQVFRDSVICGDISFEDYKKLKWIYRKDDIVASQSGCILSDGYYLQKKELLESELYLRFDYPLIHPTKLKRLFGKYNMRVLTKRKYPDRLYNELKRLNLSFLLDDIVVLGWGNQVKKNWIADNYADSSVIMIGDGEEELAVSELSQSVVIMVNSGLYSCWCTKNNVYNVADINEMEGVLNSIFP